MEETIERQNLAQLNQERKGEETVEKTDEPESSPDITALIIFLPLALVADLAGAFSDLTVFLSIPARIINIPILGILWLWRIMKQGAKKDYTWQLMFAFLIEMSPFGIVPTWTTFVLYVYFKDTSLGKQTIGKIEKLNKSKTK